MTVLGVISAIACLTSIVGLIPQIVKLHLTRSARDLSVSMVVNFTVCAGAWTAYGWMTDAFTVWATNAVACALNTILLGQVLWYKTR